MFLLFSFYYSDFYYAFPLFITRECLVTILLVDIGHNCYKCFLAFWRILGNELLVSQNTKYIVNF